MSKLMALLANNSKNGLLCTINQSQLRLVRSLVISSSSSKKSSLVAANLATSLQNTGRRYLASESAANKQVAKQTSSSPENENDKPEWERSTRYVCVFFFNEDNRINILSSYLKLK